jgi:hypothetical protein
MSDPLDLPEFRKALERTPEAAIELSDDTRARYKQGQVPQVIRWLVRYPVLLDALRRDAGALALLCLPPADDEAVAA